MNRSIKDNEEKHEFALFVESLSVLVQSVRLQQDLVIHDETLFHRIKTVLRLVCGDTIVFFDHKISVRCMLAEFSGKKQIRCVVHEKKIQAALLPQITFLLPVLKRDDFEQALYALTEVGVNTIQLVSTQKTRTAWSGQKELERAKRIIVSAAEQSKNFSFPELKAPVPLLTALDISASVKIFFEPDGISAFSLTQQLREKQPNHLVLLVGPEGDLSNEEKKMVVAERFLFCALTPTVLRAVQAAGLGAGLVRSLLR
jgi:16S rRNA (uracil1498-N3)-methyltransferase